MAPISFARGAPSPACLDPELISSCAEAVLARDGTTILAYGAGRRLRPAPRAARRAPRRRSGPRLPHDRWSPGLRLLRRPSSSQRRPGRVLVEAPTYDRPLKLLGWQGAEVVPLAMDDEGLDPDALEAELARGGDISFLYTIPTFQNPSGRTLGEERRRRIAELCRDARRRRARGRPLRARPLRGDARRRRCTSSRAASASRSRRRSRRRSRPGLRVGWFVVPEALRVGVRRPRGLDVHLAAAAAAGDRPRALRARRVRAEPRAGAWASSGAQRDAMLEALEAELAGRATWSRPEGGYFLWVDLPDGRRRGRAAHARDRGRA